MHSFDPKIAQQVGVNAAVIYQNIRWWCEKNAANEKNVIDGHVWSYNSVRAFTTLFPYLTAKQVRTALETLENEGLILVANYNTDPRDRTKWYAVAGHEVPSEEKPEAEAGLAPEGKAVCPTGQSTFAPEGKPLPVNKPVNKPVGKPEHDHRDAAIAPAGSSDDPVQGELIPSEAPKASPPSKQKIAGGLYDGCQSLDEEFERVWAKHPRKVGKGAARKAWAKARAKTEFRTIAEPLALWIKLQAGTDPKFIPHFSTWLNEERWADDQTHARNKAETTSDRLDRLGEISTEDGCGQVAGPKRKLPEIELRID